MLRRPVESAEGPAAISGRALERLSADIEAIETRTWQAPRRKVERRQCASSRMSRPNHNVSFGAFVHMDGLDLGLRKFASLIACEQHSLLAECRTQVLHIRRAESIFIAFSIS